jgi:hypothetical protein
VVRCAEIARARLSALNLGYLPRESVQDRKTRRYTSASSWIGTEVPFAPSGRSLYTPKLPARVISEVIERPDCFGVNCQNVRLASGPFGRPRWRRTGPSLGAFRWNSERFGVPRRRPGIRMPFNGSDPFAFNCI